MDTEEQRPNPAKGGAFFQLACQDVARLTSVLNFDSNDILKPRSKQGKLENLRDQLRYFGSALYLAMFGGFVPYFYKILPFRVFQIWSILNTLMRKNLLSPILRLLGYGRLCSWSNKNAPGKVKPSAEELKPYTPVDTTRVGRLATLDMIDPELNTICAALYSKHAVMLPHSQANPNLFRAAYDVFTSTKFPGNFFDHLIGVWKALQAWEQPRYICRGGFFHSVYGTNQYRNYLWRYDERQKVKELVGPAAEELAFLICTAERGDLTHDLCEQMYAGGKLEGSVRALAAASAFRAHAKSGKPMTARLGEEGFAVTNHITGKSSVFPPRTFAAFTMVMIADFLEQGVSGFGYHADDDISLFSYIKVGFWADVINFVSPYLDVVPPVFAKYNLLEPFAEPSRNEILTLKRAFKGEVDTNDKAVLTKMIKSYPWLAEPNLALARLLDKDEIVEGMSKDNLLRNAKKLVQEWGMLHLKDIGHPREFMALIEQAR